MKEKILEARRAVIEGKLILLLTIKVPKIGTRKYIDVYEDKENYYVDLKDGSERKKYSKNDVGLEDLGVELIVKEVGKPTDNFGIEWKFEVIC